MRVTLESTTRIVSADGIECRVWQGKTDSGIEVQALIPRIACSANEDLSEFQRELTEHQAPSPAVQMFPARMIL